MLRTGFMMMKSSLIYQSYGYALDNIPCACRLCNCPSSGGSVYTFRHVNNDKKYIYFDTPKCGSSTIRKKINSMGFPLHQTLINPTLPLNQYFKFSVVRNPYSRMVSNFKMFTRQEHRIFQLKAMTNRKIETFYDFVRFAVVIPNHHWQPQTIFIPEDDCDYIGKLEEMDETLNFLSTQINDFDNKPLALNKSEEVDKTNCYKSYYCSETFELVSQFYKDDIQNFSYSF